MYCVTHLIISISLYFYLEKWLHSTGDHIPYTTPWLYVSSLVWLIWTEVKTLVNTTQPQDSITLLDNTRNEMTSLFIQAKLAPTKPLYYLTWSPLYHTPHHSLDHPCPHVVDFACFGWGIPFFWKIPRFRKRMLQRKQKEDCPSSSGIPCYLTSLLLSHFWY